MGIYRIGLTGSIGSGKSTVSKIIKNSGITVLDADEISRGLTSDNSPILSELEEAFGRAIINEDGSLNRRELAAIAFSHEEKKKILTEIVTKKVEAIMWDMVSDLEDKEKLVVMDIPLLFECDLGKRFDEVWSVVADKEIRFARAHERDGISREDFDARDRAQVPESYKMAYSDIIIHNDKDLKTLENKVVLEIKRIRKITGLD